MAYVDLNKRRQTRSNYNKLEYAATKADPAMYELYLERQRKKKRNRTAERQNRKLELAAIRMYTHCHGPECFQVTFYELRTELQDRYRKLATAVLYPERLIK